MNKKLLLIWTFLLCFVMGMSADEVTITFKDNGGTTDTNSSTTAMTDLVTEGSQALLSGFSTSGKVYQAQSGLGIKFGNSSTTGSVELTLKESYKATKLIVKAAGYADNSNTLAVNGTNVTGFAKKVATEKEVELDGSDLSKITVATVSGQTRSYLQSITIVYGTGGSEQPTVAAPTIAGTTPFFGTTEVTLACATEGAKVYYTIDGTEPTNASTEYTAPFTLDASATVKAIAYNGDKASTVATKAFVKNAEVATIAELTALENGKEFKFTGELTVLALPTQKHLYVKDATGSTLVYGTDLAFEAGQHVAANWTGKVSVYKSLFEAVPTSTLEAVADVKDDITYDQATAADVTLDNVNKVVVLKGVSYIAPKEGSKNFTIMADGETAADVATIAGYNQFGLTIDAAVDGETYDIVGAISRYNDDVQFQPISITRCKKTMTLDVEVRNGANISTVVNMEREYIETDLGNVVGDINITLPAGAEVTITEPIIANGGVQIIGDATAPATIDASALADAMIKMGEPNVKVSDKGFYLVGDVFVDNVNIKGLQKQLFYANKQKVLVDYMRYENGVMQLNGGNATIFDTNGGGVVADLRIKNSTIYSVEPHTGALYSSQSGNKATEAGVELQSLSIKNSTLYNIAKDKNVCSHRQANQKWLAFEVDSCVVLDCGKDGQFVKGLNGGQGGANPVWSVYGNSFLRTVDGNVENHGLLETTGDADEPITDNVLDVPAFDNLAAGDFTVDAGSLQAKKAVGDPRWLQEYDITLAHPQDIVLKTATGEDLAQALDAVKSDFSDFDYINSIELQLAAGGSYTASQTLEANSGLYITGDAESPATIDLSGLTAPFIALSATPNEVFKAADNEYYHLDDYVDVKNVNINNLKGQLFSDNGAKWCLHSMNFENCNIKLTSDETTGINNAALIQFKGGYANMFAMYNCTVWQAGPSDCKYFMQYANGVKAGKTGHELDGVTFVNNTFYNVAKAGQWANYSGLAGQKTSYFSIAQNIFKDCGNGDVARRILGGRTANSYAEDAASFLCNTYMFDKEVEGVMTTVYEDNASYDVSGTQVNYDPLFADAANGDFTVGASTRQAKYMMGDSRWLVTFVPEDVTDARATLLAEIENAKALLGDADVETNEAAKALADAIEEAQSVYDESEFNDEISQATDDLKAAEAAYNTATGINAIDTDAAEAEGKWYNLQGVRIAKPTVQGVYVHNGKKVVLK